MSWDRFTYAAITNPNFEQLSIWRIGSAQAVCPQVVGYNSTPGALFLGPRRWCSLCLMSAMAEGKERKPYVDYPHFCLDMKYSLLILFHWPEDVKWPSLVSVGREKMVFPQEGQCTPEPCGTVCCRTLHRPRNQCLIS